MALPHAWLALEGRHLAAFEAVVRHGSFTRAGQELGYSQPAISQQLAALERAVGSALLARPGVGRPPELTAAGEALLPHARTLLGALGDAHAALAAAQDRRAGVVRVGTFQSAAERLLPDIIATLAETHPEVEVDVVESHDGGALEDAVASGTLDVAFAVVPAARAGLEEVVVTSDPFRLVVARDAPLAARASVSLAEAAALPLVGLRSCRAQAQIEAWARDAAHPLRVGPRHDDHGLIHGRVASGAFAAVLPALAISEHHAGVRSVPFEPPVPPRVIGLVTDAARAPSPATRAFVEVARTAGRPALAAGH